MAKTRKNGPIYLSKTLFLKGLQCHKALYLFKFHPELRDELSGSQEAIFQSGTQLGILAQGLFPGGREIPYGGLSESPPRLLLPGYFGDGKAFLKAKR
jgi:hypothetical protein